MSCAFILSKQFLIVKLPRGMFFEKQAKFFRIGEQPAIGGLLLFVYYDVKQGVSENWQRDRQRVIFQIHPGFPSCRAAVLKNDIDFFYQMEYNRYIPKT